jgi:hypothetical protein
MKKRFSPPHEGLRQHAGAVSSPGRVKYDGG